MGAQFQATLNFGTTPTDEASVTVATGVAGIVAGSFVEAFFMRNTTADNGLDEHEGMSVYCRLVCGEIVAATSFTVRANMLAGFATGQFNVMTVWN